MSDEIDEVAEAVRGQVHLAVGAAAQFGGIAAEALRARFERAREEQAAEARMLGERLEAERRVARAQLAGVEQDQWWDTAVPDQIANTYAVARAWRDEDEIASTVERRMREELRTRYGVDVDELPADRAAVEAAVEDRLKAEEERRRSQLEEAEAARLMLAAEDLEHEARVAREASRWEPHEADRDAALDQADEHDRHAAELTENSDVAYDSAERREADARALADAGIEPAVVATRTRADVSQARPAVDAVAEVKKGRAATAHKGRARGVRTQRSEPGR